MTQLPAFLLFLAVLGFSCSPGQPAPLSTCQWEGFDSTLERFSKIITFKTVSDPTTPNHARDPEEFVKLDQFLAASYPRVWSELKVEKVGVDNLSFLITWPGKNASLRPVLLVSHVDVVPVTEETLKDWTHPPFSGAVADGYIWGRGTMDVKITVVTLLESAAALLDKGWAPERTLIFAFGQDEEVGGACGAAKMAELLQSRGVELEVIWDEGPTILRDGFPPVTHAPVALVATAEKGYQSVEVRIKSKGGHSSMPPTDGTSVGSIAGRILAKLDANPPPCLLKSPTTDFVKGLAKTAPVWLRPLLSLADQPLLAPLMGRLLAAASAEMAALVRTTVAVTHMQAGVGDNVLPQQGSLNLNFRLLPGDTPESVLKYLHSVIGRADAEHVELVLAPANRSSLASPVSPANGTYFKLLKQAIQEHYSFDGKPPDVVPLLLMGLTDSRNYVHLSRYGTLRFVPTTMSITTTPKEPSRLHGLDERTALPDFNRALCVTKRALELFGGAHDGRGVGGDAAQPAVHSEL